MLRKRAGPSAVEALTSTDSELKSLRRRQRRVMAGLLLTFVGVLALGAILPVGPGALLHAVPFAAVALLGLWVGGILLGSRGAPRGSPARRP
ncbi:MAG: hypothetical protein L3K13_04950 [Thermoplasmata archaeon]|nr:hypothetical protein [Thermoplasmata archaeon]